MISENCKKLLASFEKRKQGFELMANSSAIGFVTSDNQEYKNNALMYLGKAQLMKELIEEICRADV